MDNLFEKITKAGGKLIPSSNDEVCFFLRGNNLSTLNRLSLNSYLYHGHIPVLYAYEPIPDVPDGVIVRDASTILPEDEFKITDRYKNILHKDSVVEQEITRRANMHFSDLFRYVLLHKKGGWWSDLDVVCMKPFDFVDVFVFAGTLSIVSRAIIANNNVIKCPPSTFFSQRLVETEREIILGIKKDEIQGVSNFNEVVHGFRLKKYCKPPLVFNFLNFMDSYKLFDSMSMPEGIYGLHFWSSQFYKMGIDPEKTYPRSSPFEILKKKYL
jgi:hypothetical protein